MPGPRVQLLLRSGLGFGALFAGSSIVHSIIKPDLVRAGLRVRVARGPIPCARHRHMLRADSRACAVADSARPEGGGSGARGGARLAEPGDRL